jgi:hypothetical protein
MKSKFFCFGNQNFCAVFWAILCSHQTKLIKRYKTEKNLWEHNANYIRHINKVITCKQTKPHDFLCNLFIHYQDSIRSRYQTCLHTTYKLESTYNIKEFHGGDYEECRRPGYKNSVPTSLETHYISTKAPSQLMLCKIWGFHGGDCEECRLLGCDAVWLL